MPPIQALFIALPAAGCDRSKRFYEPAPGLPIMREHRGGLHRLTDYDPGGLVLNVHEWLAPYHGSGRAGLVIETAEPDGAVERAARFGAAVTVPEVHARGGRCGKLFSLFDARQHGDA